MIDDAEEMIEDLWSATRKLHGTGRQNILFLLAARDTDWRAKGGQAKSWSSHLNKLDDLVLGRIGNADAELVVEAWAGQGDRGLRALKDKGTRDARAVALVDAARAQDVRAGEGSFFGGLLETRFGTGGLIDHLLPLLESLRQQRVEGGSASLFEALLYVANCHATGMAGLDNRVLAALCGVPAYRVSSAIIAPLGKELGAAESRGHVLTRHKRVAEAIVVAADRLGADLASAWRHLVDATVRVSKEEKVGATYSPIILAGARLKRDLPQALDPVLRGEVGIAAAEAAMAAVPEWTSTISALANALRSAGYPQEAFDLLKGKLSHVKNTIDKEMVIRGYLYEWSTCAGQLEGRRGSIMDAWLAALSLSDIVPVGVTSEQAKMSCAGLGGVFKRLGDGTPASVYAKGCRAVTQLGWQAKSDERATGILTRYQHDLDNLGTPKPANNDEALAWLAEAAFTAWQELDDPYLRNLKKDGRLSFNALATRLSTS